MPPWERMRFTRSEIVCIWHVEMLPTSTGSTTSSSIPRMVLAVLFRKASSMSMVTKAIPIGPTSVSSFTICPGALYIFSASRLTNIANISSMS